jgi:hypothetical protein
VADEDAMKRRTIIFLIVLVACGMAGSYVTRLIVAQRSARMTFWDKCLLGAWVELLRACPEMQDLPSRADAARNWAKQVAHEDSKADGVPIEPANCPVGLTQAQAMSIRNFVSFGFNSGRERPRPELTWKDVLMGSIPLRDKKPSDCLNPNFLDQYPHEPLESDETWYQIFPRPEKLVAHREALDRLADDHALLQLIDQCWQIGYEAGCSPSDER